jgi:hypothetical protein
VSTKGGSYARFQRALEADNLQAVRLAALELPYVKLTDGLAICVLMRQKRDERVERAAVRLLARLALERPRTTLPELRDAAVALMGLPAPQAHARLVALCEQC